MGVEVAVDDGVLVGDVLPVVLVVSVDVCVVEVVGVVVAVDEVVRDVVPVLVGVVTSQFWKPPPTYASVIAFSVSAIASQASTEAAMALPAHVIAASSDELAPSSSSGPRNSAMAC